MVAGIKVWNADGSLAYDSGQYRLFRLVARINYGTSNGSASFDRKPEDTDLTPVAGSWYPPVFSISGNAVSWDFANVPQSYRIAGLVEIWAH